MVPLAYGYFRKNRKKILLMLLFSLVLCFALCFIQLTSANNSNNGIRVYSSSRRLDMKLSQDIAGKRRREIAGFSLVNTTDPVIQLSQNTNHLLREKFQRKRIHRFCTRHKRQMRYFVFPYRSEERKLLFNHLLFNDKHKSIFCYVEQVQCSAQTAAKLFSNVQQQRATNADDPMKSFSAVDEMRIYGMSFANTTLNSITRRRKLKNYYKTMIVINPLVRLLTSYLALIHDRPVTNLQETIFPNSIKIQILQRYRSVEYRLWRDAGMNYPLHVTFSEFIEYIIDTSFSDLSPHFQPTTELCHPCRVHYDFYGNSKRCSQDMRAILSKNKIAEGRATNSYDGGVEDYDLLKYYRELPSRLTSKLVRKWYIELDFYYHLYPEERNSHKKLLDI